MLDGPAARPGRDLMPLIDLSATVDAHLWEPDPITHTILSAAEGAKHMTEGMRTAFGVDFSPRSCRAASS